MNKIFSIFCALLFISSYNLSQGWFAQQSGTTNRLNAVHFVDAQTGYAVGDSGSYHIILKTTNGGLNWYRVNLPYPSNFPALKSVYFLDANMGFVCGSDAPASQVFRTSNGGISWAPLNPPGGIYGMQDIYFINSLTGMGVGSAYSSAGYIFRTTNGGSTWTIIAGAGNVLYSIYFVDANTGYTCGTPGIILKSTNAGASWTPQNSTTTTILRSIYFINSSSGWAAGADSKLYRTTNGGNTWALFYNQSLCGLYSVSFFNELTGWVCGCEAAINGTTNGGSNWVLQSFASTTYLYSMSFVSPATGWAVGTGGRILKTTTGGVTAIQPVSTEIAEKFSLHQNYPNPFNPVTKIRFSIPAVGAQYIEPVQLEVYDILGREVATLVNEELKPGTYEVEWDASNFSTGVYYYNLVSGDYTETKKMMLVR